jgi:hypothetical protein
LLQRETAVLMKANVKSFVKDTNDHVL